MEKIKVILQNNKVFETEVDKYSPKELYDMINSSEGIIILIGDILVNKHHVECIHKC